MFKIDWYESSGYNVYVLNDNRRVVSMPTGTGGQSWDWNFKAARKIAALSNKAGRLTVPKEFVNRGVVIYGKR